MTIPKQQLLVHSYIEMRYTGDLFELWGGLSFDNENVLSEELVKVPGKEYRKESQHYRR